MTSKNKSRQWLILFGIILFSFIFGYLVNGIRIYQDEYKYSLYTIGNIQ